jgi:hypothetical protein
MQVIVSSFHMFSNCIPKDRKDMIVISAVGPTSRKFYRCDDA